MCFVKEPRGYLKSWGPVPGSDWVGSPHCFLNQEKPASSQLPLLWEKPKLSSRHSWSSLGCTAASTSLLPYFAPWQFTWEPQKSFKSPFRVLGDPWPCKLHNQTAVCPRQSLQSPPRAPPGWRRTPRDLPPFLWKYVSKFTAHPSPFSRTLNWDSFPISTFSCCP